MEGAEVGMEEEEAVVEGIDMVIGMVVEGGVVVRLAVGSASSVASRYAFVTCLCLPYILSQMGQHLMWG